MLGMRAIKVTNGKQALADLEAAVGCALTN
jgi:hypothetical protein